MSEEKKDFVHEEITLTVEQQEKILSQWASGEKAPSLKKMVEDTFPEITEELKDGRSKYGRCLKAFLTSVDLKARPAQQYTVKGFLELTDEQKSYIKDNVGSQKPLDITKVLFDNPELTNLGQECRTVNEFIKTLPPETLIVESDINVDVYEAPKTFDKMLSKVNSYIYESVQKHKMSPKQRKDVQSLIGYLNTVRFVHQINTYSEADERRLFESSFVRYTYDKFDLTQEEVDQYIVLATEVVISSTIQATIQIIQIQVNHEIENGGKIPMALIEANNTARTEYNQCVNRQQKLLNDLKEKRSTRLSKEIKATASILNLVELWKEEESRVKLLKLAELRKQVLNKEMDNLSSMDEVKARILGISGDEVLNG